MSAINNVLTDDSLYATAMIMFAMLPMLSMRSRSGRQHTQADSNVEPARVVAVVAFILLLWLQLRKRYALGVGLVAVNLLLRLYEMIVVDHAATLLWAWTTQPRPPWRQSRKEAVILLCIFGACGSTSVKIAVGLVAPVVIGQSALSAAIINLLATTLVYPVVLLSVGTFAGRHEFCAQLVCRQCRGYRLAGSRIKLGSRTRDMEV